MRRKAPPVSSVIPTDEEVANTIRTEMDGQPEEWVSAAVDREMMERATVQRWNQQAYDGKTDGRFKAVTKPILDKDGEVTGSATYTMIED